MTNFERRKYLRSMCPCRVNSSEDIDGWNDVFNKAKFGSYSERKAAAHTIGTLLEKANTVSSYRNLLKRFECELNDIMDNPKTASSILGTMKRHGHAHKGAARQGYRKVYKTLQIQSPEEIASWINRKFSLKQGKSVKKSDHCVKRMVKWIEHRVKFQPNRTISEETLLKQLKRFNPTLWTSS